jgi:hypothetical protein
MKDTSYCITAEKHVPVHDKLPKMITGEIGIMSFRKNNKLFDL